MTAEEASSTATDPDELAAPEPDPETCKAIAIGLHAFLEGMDDGEWDDTEFRYYLEPAGILHGPLKCARAPEDEPQRAGLLMTRAGWQAKKVFLNDGINPDTYELSFPKEFGYVKPLAHYRPATYEHAKYPWSKKY
jgi:hypothetical protein